MSAGLSLLRLRLLLPAVVPRSDGLAEAAPADDFLNFENFLKILIKISPIYN